MAIYGYHRTSTKEQHLDRGITAIMDYCKQNNITLERIVTDQQTGKNFNRPKYQSLKEFIRKGDTLIVTEVDRLGRNKQATLEELQDFKKMGVRIMILELPTTLMNYEAMGDDMAKMMLETINNMLIEMYATFAHAEMQKKEKRQAEGIQAMKDRGEWEDYGRPRAIDPQFFIEQYKRVQSGEIKPFDLIKELGITKPTYYRYKQIYIDGVDWSTRATKKKD